MNKLAEIDLEFFQEVMEWDVRTVQQLPSFSVARGDALGWAILNRELQKCSLIRNFIVEGVYVVVAQKQKGMGLGIGEGETLALATTLALININQCKYASLQEIQYLNQTLLRNYLEHLAAINRFYLIFQHRKVLDRDLKIAV